MFVSIIVARRIQYLTDISIIGSTVRKGNSTHFGTEIQTIICWIVRISKKLTGGNQIVTLIWYRSQPTVVVVCTNDYSFPSVSQIP